MQFILQFLPLIAVFAVMYFLMIRPQQKQMKEKMDMLANLTPGQEVVTIGGLHGIVDEVNRDNGTVVLDCEGIFLTYELNSVAKVTNSSLKTETTVEELSPSEEEVIEETNTEISETAEQVNE